MQKIVLATDNLGKVREIAAILKSVECVSQSHFKIKTPPETGQTFIENAMIKARHACQLTNLPALADDSGLIIPALNDEPGIFSARFAGENASDMDNIQLVLNKIKTKGLQNPPAYFYCAVVIMRHPKDPTPIVTTGKLYGEIINNPSGNNGFGYDPIFYLKKYNSTLAELCPDIKNTISHRCQALQSCAKYIK